jgi:hypothetical protein
MTNDASHPGRPELRRGSHRRRAGPWPPGGVTKFPDPDSHGDIGINAGPGSGIDPNSPQFKAADRVCKPLLPAPNAGQAAKDRPALLRYARCMRARVTRPLRLRPVPRWRRRSSSCTSI